MFNCIRKLCKSYIMEAVERLHSYAIIPGTPATRRGSFPRINHFLQLPINVKQEQSLQMYWTLVLCVFSANVIFNWTILRNCFQRFPKIKKSLESETFDINWKLSQQITDCWNKTFSVTVVVVGIKWSANSMAILKRCK